jgi:hypothetical protein
VDLLFVPFLAIAGFFAGSLFFQQILRWGALIWVATTTHGGDFLGPPRRRLLWVLPFVVLLHPAPYLVAFLIGLTVWALLGKAGPVWPWLLGGFYLNLTFSGLVVLRSYRLRRRRPATAGPNNRWRGP